MNFPAIDPIALQIGPLAVHWYALAYLAGIVGGWQYAIRIARRHAPIFTKEIIDDAIFWVTLGIILGGRIGYCLFYKPEFYLANPTQILMVWRGGMSFHGGFLGVLIAIILFTRKNNLPFWRLIDIAACVTPIGLFFGRIANFINGELYGRVTDAAWGVVFPRGGEFPRHPSQLYEAALEGLLMLAAFYILQTRSKMLSKPMLASGLFLTFYGASRFFVEFYREPDDFLGLLALGLSMGQWLCAPMILAGIYLSFYAVQKKSNRA